MSFQRRNKVITRPAPPGIARMNPRAAPLSGPRGFPATSSVSSASSASAFASASATPAAANITTRPSTLTSLPVISSGSADLDRHMRHGGIPLGTSLLIEEAGSTDYASVLTKYFAAQGVAHNRIDHQQNCHVVAVGVSSSWSRDLPGVYRGSRSALKKQAAKEETSKLSVLNVVDSVNTKRDLKIAWRYGLGEKNAADNSANSANDNSMSTYPHYSNTFDITTRLSPGPSAQDITFVAVSGSLLALAKQIESLVQLHSKQGKIVRIVVPNLLNPSVYSAEMFKPSEILGFLHVMQNILKKYCESGCLIASISLDLFSIGSQKNSLMLSINRLFDSVFQLVPFEQDLYKMLEKSYKTQPTKIQQGFFNVIKISGLTDKGSMEVKMNEYAFRNGRKNFEIGEWSIPVENEATEEAKLDF